MVADHIELNMNKDKDIVAITPAMIHGSCMDDIFEHFPNRSFDVGIAEEHALTFTAGLAIAKKNHLFLYIHLFYSGLMIKSIMILQEWI